MASVTRGAQQLRPATRLHARGLAAQVFDRQLKQHHRERAASNLESLNQYSYLRDEIAERLMDRLDDVHESYSFGGLSNTWLLHQSVANYALEHAPALSWRFGQFGSKDDLGQHDNSAFQDLLFSTERDGPGRRCRRDGLDGDVSRRFCLHCPGASGRGTRGCAVGQMVLGEPPKDGLLQDGDTLTAGGCSGQEGAAYSSNRSLRCLALSSVLSRMPCSPHGRSSLVVATATAIT